MLAALGSLKEVNAKNIKLMRVYTLPGRTATTETKLITRADLSSTMNQWEDDNCQEVIHRPAIRKKGPRMTRP
ncbi:unnamed protein product, partial [Iphiclides podalirius]